MWDERCHREGGGVVGRMICHTPLCAATQATFPVGGRVGHPSPPPLHGRRRERLVWLRRPPRGRGYGHGEVPQMDRGPSCWTLR